MLCVSIASRQLHFKKEEISSFFNKLRNNMFGLIMPREYLEEILVVEKSFYERSYSTNKRGKIALIDIKKSLVIGTMK